MLGLLGIFELTIIKDEPNKIDIFWIPILLFGKICTVCMEKMQLLFLIQK